MASETRNQNTTDPRQQGRGGGAATEPRLATGGTEPGPETRTAKTLAPETPDPETPNPETPNPETPARETWVRLAQLVRPQGRKGELLAEILTDFPERFQERRRLFLRAPSAATKHHEQPREIALEEHWLHKGRLVLKFGGVDSIEAAETLRGYDVVIPYTERAPLEQGAVYIGDLLGCTLFDRATDTTVGEIIDVDRESTNMELIVVRQTGSGAELLVPFANSYDPHIDLPARRMEMTLPSGLLTLHEPPTDEERRLAREAQAAEQVDQAGGTSPETTGKRPKARKRPS